MSKVVRACLRFVGAIIAISSSVAKTRVAMASLSFEAIASSARLSGAVLSASIRISETKIPRASLSVGLSIARLSFEGAVASLGGAGIAKVLSVRVWVENPIGPSTRPRVALSIAVSASLGTRARFSIGKTEVAMASLRIGVSICTGICVGGAEVPSGSLRVAEARVLCVWLRVESTIGMGAGTSARAPTWISRSLGHEVAIVLGRSPSTKVSITVGPSSGGLSIGGPTLLSVNLSIKEPAAKGTGCCVEVPILSLSGEVGVGEVPGLLLRVSLSIELPTLVGVGLSSVVGVRLRSKVCVGEVPRLLGARLSIRLPILVGVARPSVQVLTPCLGSELSCPSTIDSILVGIVLGRKLPSCEMPKPLSIGLSHEVPKRVRISLPRLCLSSGISASSEVLTLVCVSLLKKPELFVLGRFGVGRAVLLGPGVRCGLERV